jgi:hypothetical protein
VQLRGHYNITISNRWVRTARIACEDQVVETTIHHIHMDGGELSISLEGPQTLITGYGGITVEGSTLYLYF